MLTMQMAHSGKLMNLQGGQDAKFVIVVMIFINYCNKILIQCTVWIMILTIIIMANNLISDKSR